jgi:hypothetical protein
VIKPQDGEADPSCTEGLSIEGQDLQFNVGPLSYLRQVDELPVHDRSITDVPPQRDSLRMKCRVVPG